MPGINLTLHIGKANPQPAPRLLMDALQSVEVTHSDSARSGFQLVFQVGRAGTRDLQDDPLFRNHLLTPFNRVILVITIRAKAAVIMDGIITHQEFSPNTTPGQTTLTITGEDISVMMDQSQAKQIQHPQQSERTIVQKILSSADYAKYTIIPDIHKPPADITPTRNERIPAQSGSDLAYLRQLGERFDYVFFMTPGPGIGQNTAYWGPRPRGNNPQGAITVNMSSFTNAESVNVKFDAQAATQVQGRIQDRKTNRIQPLRSTTSDRPALAVQSALQLQRKQNVQRVQTYEETGHEFARAAARTQAMVNRAAEPSITVTGELDTLRYGDVLRLRELVAVRGIGNTNDGLYYVKSVTHRIRKGQYQQAFTVTREGRNSTISRVGR
jgi:hypothetical protein